MGSRLATMRASDWAADTPPTGLDRVQPKPLWRWRRGLVTGLMACGLVVAAGCTAEPGAAVSSSSSNPGSSSTVRVATVEPERATLKRVVEQPGQVVAIESTPIHARLGGYVASVAVDIGDRVTKGQVLAEIEAPEAVAELEQKRALADQAGADKKQADAALAVAKAGVKSAEAKSAEVRAGLRRLEADVARWQAESARTEQLARDAAVTTSLRDETRSKLESARGALEEGQAQARTADAALEEARARVEKAQADIASALATIQVAGADVHRAEALLGFSHVVAPFDGVVRRRSIDPGHLTVAGPTGDPLFVVDRTDRVTLCVAVPEADAALIGAGDVARARFPALDGRTIETKLSRVAFALDESTHTVRAEADLANPEGTLRPGLYAHVSIIAAERPDVLTIPASALLRDGAKTLAVVVDAGTARRREVATGLSDGTRVEVLRGLGPAERIIAVGADAIADGQHVAELRGKP